MAAPAKPGAWKQFCAALTPPCAAATNREAPRRIDGQNHLHENRVAHPAGGVLGGGAGLAWTEIFKTSSFEGYGGMPVFFTFMPLGALIGGLGGRCCSA
jgi:hypothetical protein